MGEPVRKKGEPKIVAKQTSRRDVTKATNEGEQFLV